MEFTCFRWALNSYCERRNAHYTFMKEHCAKTCQFCIKEEEKTDTHKILGNKTGLVSNREWRIYYDTSKHEDYSDVVDLGMMTREEIQSLGKKFFWIRSCSALLQFSGHHFYATLITP